jgi:hypothetical protein
VLSFVSFVVNEFIMVVNEFIAQKKAPQFPEGLNLKSATTYSPVFTVPSALAGLTSLFGMGRGGAPPL